MHILYDGDILAYRIAYSGKMQWSDEAQDEVRVSLSPIEAIEKLKEVFGEIRNKVDPFADYTLYLTGKGNFRYDIAKTAVYKGNRKDTVKPQNLPYLRQYMINTYNCVVSEGEEADDLIAIEASRRNYKDVVIVSVDKDFHQLPCKIYNPTRDEWYHPTPWEATKFFYTQILTGDTVDNIKGIYGVGPKKADKILNGCDSEKSLYNACVEAYEGDKQRVLENGRLLWLRRYVGQLWEAPV